MKTRRTVNSVLTALLIIISIALIAVTLAPRLAGFSEFSINSDSMYPTLKKGSLVIVKPIAFDEIEVGDILTFEDNHTGKSFTHRVADIYTEKKQFVTKGDNRSSCDPKTTGYECVRGKLEVTIPYMGYPALLVSSFLGKLIFAMILIIGLAIEIEILMSGKRGEKTE